MGFFSKLFRKKVSDLEAKLLPVAGCAFGGIGEVEYELWSDGSGSLEASIKHTALPDAARVEVYLGSARVTTLSVNRGYAKEVLYSDHGRPLPQAREGDRAELRYEGQVLYQGHLRRD